MTSNRYEPPPRSYDEWYRSGDAFWEEAPGKSVLVAAMKRCCDPSRSLRLLDVGCGTGTFLDRLGREVAPPWQYYGVDLAQAAIEMGRQRFPNLRLQTIDATSMPFPSGSFDVVTCYGSWEHFAEPAHAIAEAARVLVPGGWFFAMIPALGVHRTDRDDEGWYEDTEVEGCECRQLQWNLRRETWARKFGDAGLLLLEDSLAAECGAFKPGVFFFGVRSSAAHGNPSPVRRALLDLSDLAARVAATVEPDLQAAVDLVEGCFERGGKILACGNGGSAADAQHFVAELVGRMSCERPALAALALSSDPSVVTALANDYGYERVFSRQVEGLGKPGDILLAISTSGRSANLVQALRTARQRGLGTLALLGCERRAELAKLDVAIHIPESNAQRVQEIHTALLHALCGEIEKRIGGRDP